MTKLSLLPIEWTIHRCEKDREIPPSLVSAPFVWIARTDEELSIVCASSISVASERRSGGWRALKVAGPIDFAVTGLLAGLTAPLAAAAIPVFALSTFDTDYILIRGEDLDPACEVLAAAGCEIVQSAPETGRS